MHLALTGVFRAKWSADVHEEWMRSLLANRPDITREKLERTRQLMDKAAPDALVSGYEHLIPGLFLPDPKDRLLLATSRGKPNGKLLRTLNRLAKNAGLNCERCEPCKEKARECSEWTLHEFRRTYCTTILRAGVDLRTVQAYILPSHFASASGFDPAAHGR